MTTTLETLWPDAPNVARNLTDRGFGGLAEDTAEFIEHWLNANVPVYDKSHSIYLPENALENGMSTCRVRAYLAHLIAHNVEGMKSGVLLSVSDCHAQTYVSDGETAYVVDSSNSADSPVSVDIAAEYIEGATCEHQPLAGYFLETERLSGVVWKTDEQGTNENAGDSSSPNGYPLDLTIPDISDILFIGDSATIAIGELLKAKQEVANSGYKTRLKDLLEGNIFFPNAVAVHPDFH